MAIFRCLQRILKNPKSATTTTATTIATTFFKLPRQFSLLSHRTPFLSPLSFVISDVTPGGPLFLSSPPWQLSQSATPTLVQYDVVFPRKLRILERSNFRFPIKLGFRNDDRRESDEPALNAVISNSVKREISGGGGLAESFVNWPNFVSVSRMVSGPVLGWMIVNEWYLPAFVGLAISGASDWLDGYLARRMGINSVVGSYLDPLADKVLVGCVALAMVENNLLHPGLVGLVVLRDVMLVGGAVYKRASSLSWQWVSWYEFFNLDGTRPEKIEPLFISKVNTVFQLILVAAALLQPELGNSDTQAYIKYLSWLVASTTVASTASYGAQYMRNKSISISRSC
ncbi:hypothetical protein RND81_10G014100 [Saponaria officinalis]|uniref:Uncharacterized protein n=1 Tax=Saponaria officinalis TaxID=3572 RepID=A0AAW1HXB6_SAPOF